MTRDAHDNGREAAACFEEVEIRPHEMVVVGHLGVRVHPEVDQLGGTPFAALRDVPPPA
jgi:hypothetical protein